VCVAEGGAETAVGMDAPTGSKAQISGESLNLDTTSVGYAEGNVLDNSANASTEAWAGATPKQALLPLATDFTPKQSNISLATDLANTSTTEPSSLTPSPNTDTPITPSLGNSELVKSWNEQVETTKVINEAAFGAMDNFNSTTKTAFDTEFDNYFTTKYEDLPSNNNDEIATGSKIDNNPPSFTALNSRKPNPPCASEG